MDPHFVVGLLLFDEYETLDLHGPLEFLGVPPTQEHFRLVTVAEKSGLVRSKQGPACKADFSFSDCPSLNILLVPGGLGTRVQVTSATVTTWLKEVYHQPQFQYLLSVCTGSGLIAAAGLLDGRRATSNKLSFAWAQSQSAKTEWIRHARWVQDGNIFTAAGVSAGMDMILAFIQVVLGEATAKEAARYAEYNGDFTDSSNDPWGRT